MKRWALRLAVVTLALGGCGPNQRRIEAYKRWYGTRARALFALAQEHLRVGQLDQARNKAQEALALDANLSGAAVLLAKVHIEQGHYKLGARQLEAVREKHPDNADVVYLLAVAWEKQGMLEKALDGYRSAHALQRENLACVTAAGEVLVAMGRLEEARVYVEGYLTEAPDEPALYELAGRLAMMCHDYPAAADRLGKACEIDYKNSKYAESLGRAQLLAGRHEEALATFGRLLSRSDYKAPAWVYSRMGDCHMALGRPAKARDAYYRACDLNGSDAGTWADVAKAALALGDNLRANLAAREALRIDQSHPEAVLVLGYALLRSDQAHEARRTLTARLGRFKDNVTFLCLLGQACEAQADHASAKHYYRMAERLDPKHELPKTLLAGAGRAGTSARPQ